MPVPNFKPRTLWSGLVLAIGVILFAAGPRYAPDVELAPIPEIDDAGRYVRAAEARFADIVGGAEKRIRWARADSARTDLSIVYVHGFSATRQEVAPFCDSLAAGLEANLFYTRLKGHGRPGDAMAEATSGDWLYDVREALAVGRAIGRRVMIVASSTGATLALWAVSAVLAKEETGSVEALVLLSPNFGPADRRSGMLLWPWGRQLADLMIGEYREWEPHNDLQRTYWTTRYPVAALFPMMASVREVARLDPSLHRTPVLVAYSPKDRVVDTSEIVEWFESVPARPKRLVAVSDPGDPSGHILAGDILSPTTTALLTRETLSFLGSLDGETLQVSTSESP